MVHAAMARATSALAALCLGAGCAGLSGWGTERAAEHLAAGRPERALRITERLLARHRERSEARELELHVEALHAVGRGVEALAFADYAERRAAGVELDDPALEESRPECTGPQEGAELVIAWGRDAPPGRELGAVAARFEIDGRGRIRRIRVLRARDPGAAWWIVETIAGAQVSSTRLASRRQAAPGSFPVQLCAWFELGGPGSREVTIPEGGCIRGFCTHMPGSAPHF